ncbi:MAG: hypothetical protein HYS32_03585 [Candidatus Woesearchaeota archaeon]|nr:MAG: hypothetical protein HYS32_03585 [Candidatus Woesearchaeota archaeon]
MKLTKVIKQPKYMIIAIASTVVMVFVYIYTQVLGNLHNVDIWFKIIPWYNAILFVIFAILFGATLGYQIYVWGQPKICKTSDKVKGAGTTSIPTLGLFFVSQCPACASLGALLLPVSTVGVLTKYSWLINLVAIGLLLFTINYLGGFRKERIN